MSFFSFGFRTTVAAESEIPEIFPFALQLDDFIKTDLVTTYTKILADTLERTYGLPEKYLPLLGDNCVQTEASQGLVTLLANAMAQKSELFLVFKPSVNVLRIATHTEQEAIRKDYKESGESAIGVFISFKNYKRSDMLRIYSNFEHCVLASLHKSLNIAKAVQIKINDLRGSVALVDAEVAKTQARSIALALSGGKDILLDVKDEVATANVDTMPTEKAIGFLDAKRAFILGLPISYISGLQTPGIGSTGEADTRAVERGLKQYFISVIRPVLLSLFGAKTKFKSQDFRQTASALEALKTFDLVSDENLSKEAKKELLRRMFDLDEKEEEANLRDEAKERENEKEAEPPVVRGLNRAQPNGDGNDEERA